MKNLHKKIIVIELIGVLSIGYPLLQVPISYADSVNINLYEGKLLSQPLDLDLDLEYLQLAGKKFGFRVEKLFNSPLYIEKNFNNPGIFIQNMYQYGLSAGIHYISVGSNSYEYYVIISQQKISPVKPWHEWEGFIRYFDFIIAQEKHHLSVDIWFNYILKK